MVDLVVLMMTGVSVRLCSPHLGEGWACNIRKLLMISLRVSRWL
jgi:hypothetical protein